MERFNSRFWKTINLTLSGGVILLSCGIASRAVNSAQPLTPNSLGNVDANNELGYADRYVTLQVQQNDTIATILDIYRTTTSPEILESTGIVIENPSSAVCIFDGFGLVAVYSGRINFNTSDLTLTPGQTTVTIGHPSAIRRKCNELQTTNLQNPNFQLVEISTTFIDLPVYGESGNQTRVDPNTNILVERNHTWAGDTTLEGQTLQDIAGRNYTLWELFNPSHNLP